MNKILTSISNIAFELRILIWMYAEGDNSLEKSIEGFWGLHYYTISKRYSSLYNEHSK